MTCEYCNDPSKPTIPLTVEFDGEIKETGRYVCEQCLVQLKKKKACEDYE